MNTLNSNLILFLKENLQRLFTKSPMFFKIWSWISLCLVLITGVPDLINSLSGIVVIPDVWNANITQAVAWASRAALFMSLLTTQSKTVAQTDEGTGLKKTDSAALPFTAKVEANVAEKQEESVPIINLPTK